MTLLRTALTHSSLLRPWVSLALLPGLDIARWLRHSSLFTFLARGFSHPGRMNPAIIRFGALFRFMLAVGTAGLFILLTFSSTGIIGAVTWSLFAFVLVGWLFFRPAILSRLTSVDLLVVLFLASAVLSTAFSSFLQTSVIGLAKMLTFVAGYVVFRTLSESGARTVAALMGLLACLGVTESFIGFYQHLHHIEPLATWTDPGINPELQMTRVFGTLKPANPNLLAGFLIPCLASALGLGLLFPLRRTMWLSALLLTGAIIMTAALVMTGSRGGFLAIVGMLGCVFAYLGHLIWHHRKLQSHRWMKILWLGVLITTLVAMAGGVAGSEKVRARVASIFAMREDSSISYRLNVYNSAFRMAKDNPLVGIGPGNGTFKKVYGLYMVPGYNALGAYSVPLEVAVEQGLIGLTIFISLLLVLALRTFLAMDSPYLTLRLKLLSGALLTGIVGSFLYGVFDTIWYRPSVNLPFWFMVAALARLTEPRNPNVFKGKL